jgi:predicted GTPase
MKRPKLSPERRAELRNRLDGLIHETSRVEQIATNASAIYDAYSEEFSKKTGLTKKDWGFLFSATALQILRQYLLTRFPERVDDQTAAKELESREFAKEKKEYLEENPTRKHRYYNPSRDEIIYRPVPFDANFGSDGALSGAGSLGHRGATPGHDPILGFVFGTANIATSTLTNWHLQSWHIRSGERKNGSMVDKFTNHASTIRIFQETANKALNREEDGALKIASALVKEVIHLLSDLPTKKSLPLPIVGTLDPNLASTLAEYGFDFSNVVTVGKQAALAAFINFIIATLHRLCYDEQTDGDITLYQVRTKKILMYSNLIASGTNALVVAFTENTKLMDLGGYAVALYELVTSVDFIERVRRDFITGEFDKLVNGVCNLTTQQISEGDKRMKNDERQSLEKAADIAALFIPIWGATYNGRKQHKAGFVAASKTYEQKYQELKNSKQQIRMDIFGEEVFVCPPGWNASFWQEKLKQFVLEHREEDVAPRQVLIDFLTFCREAPREAFPETDSEARLAETRSDLEIISKVIAASPHLAEFKSGDIQRAIDFMSFFKTTGTLEDLRTELVAALPNTNLKACNFLVLGRSGVGKSSLLNGLLGTKKFKTGVGHPVTEKGIFEEECELDGLKVHVYDSWGMEPGKVDEWRTYLHDAQAQHDLNHKVEDWFHAVIYCIDASGSRVLDIDTEIVDYLLSVGLSVVVALTKSDYVTPQAADALRRELCKASGGKAHLDPKKVIEVSVGGESRTGKTEPFGLEALKDAILANYRQTICNQMPQRCLHLVNQEIERFRTETKTWIQKREWTSDPNENSVPLRMKCEDFSKVLVQERFPEIVRQELEACQAYGRNLCIALGVDASCISLPSCDGEYDWIDKVKRSLEHAWNWVSNVFSSEEQSDDAKEHARLEQKLEPFCKQLIGKMEEQKPRIEAKVREIMGC